MNSPVSIRNVFIKAGLLFVLANLVFTLADPLPGLGRLSIYNRLVPGRVRLPYGDAPQQSYNLSLFQLDAMFASHELSARPEPEEEFRVLLIGDSATWGFLLEPDQTLAASLNAAGLRLPDGRQVRAYNLGYPVMSLAKDLLILSYAARYQPDMIVWPVTLESFPYDKQLYAPLLQHNPEPMRALIEKYGLNLDPHDPQFVDRSPLERTLIGQRRALADLLRLQLYGVMWAATGIDQAIPETYTPRMEDLSADTSFHNLAPPGLDEDDLALDVLEAGLRLAGDIPVLVANEPMFISQGQNSQIRYNFYYPRWAYDDYRRILSERSVAGGWRYLDAWESIPPQEFTNSAVHMTPRGTQLFARQLGQAVLEIAAQGK